MKKLGRAAFLGFLAMIGPAVAQQRAEWISFKPGMMGRRLVSAGTMPDGLPVYVCIAPYGGGVHPGLTGV